MVARRDLEAFGRTWIRYIREEARKDAQKSTFIPRERAFYESFYCRVELNGNLSLYSTWPWMELIVEGTKGPYKMAWLTAEKGLDIVPLRQRDGSIHFRRVPLNIGKAWIHPKIAAHTFLSRAYERAVRDWAETILTRVFEEAR